MPRQSACASGISRHHANQGMMDKSKYGRRSFGLGVLVISQILCLAQADGDKPNGWDSVLEPGLNSKGGAEKPSSVLRGTGRDLKNSNSNWSGSKKSHSWSKSKRGSQRGTTDISAVSQMSLDGMSVEECVAMGAFMSTSCTDCSILFNKMKLTDPASSSGGTVFIYNYGEYKEAVDAGLIGDYQAKFPLTCNDYPISNDVNVMKAVQMSNAISVRDYKSETLSHCIMDVMYALNINELPPNPPCVDDQSRRLGLDTTRIAEARADPYWLELEEVLEYQLIRIKYGDVQAKEKFPDDFPLPAEWANYTVNQVAQAVFDEPPCYHQSRHFHQVFAGRYGELEQDYNVLPPTGSFSEFVEGIVGAYKMCIDTVHHIGSGNFALKWYVGRARPEEINWIIYNCMNNAVCDERLPLDYVPDSIKTRITEYADEFANSAVVIDGNLVTPPHTSSTVTAATHFTAYFPGSPVHGSYPAMHSAASNWSFVCQIVYNATPQMVCEAIKTDFAVSKARTVAGVHFRLDNIDGLNIGQEQAARFLPYYFMEMGGDIDYIRQKIADKRFDWRQVDMAKLGMVDCEKATAADLAGAGVSSFAGDNSDRFSSNANDYLPQAQFGVAAGDGDTDDNADIFDAPPGFDFGYECAAK